MRGVLPPGDGELIAAAEPLEMTTHDVLQALHLIGLGGGDLERQLVGASRQIAVARLELDPSGAVVVAGRNSN